MINTFKKDKNNIAKKQNNKEDLKKIKFLTLVLLLVFFSIGVALFITVGVLSYFNVPDVYIFWVSFATIIDFLTLFLVICYIYFFKNYTRTKEIINNEHEINALASSKLSEGILIYDDEDKIVYINQWLQNNGFYRYLGKPLTSLNITTDESNNSQYIKVKDLYLKIIPYENTKTLFIKDYTETHIIRKLFKESKLAYIAFEFTLSEKLNMNPTKKIEATISAKEFIENWAMENGGIFKDNIVIANWNKIEKSVNKDSLFLEKLLKKLGKYRKEVIVSIGVATGVSNIQKIESTSNQLVQMSKNRGGNQIAIQKDNEEIIFVGKSSMSNATKDVSTLSFFIERMKYEIKESRETFITSHNMADLDALGSAIGLAWYIKSLGKQPKILIEEFDDSAKEAYNKLSDKIKESLFINKNYILENSTTRSIYIITDVSNINRSQLKFMESKINNDNLFIIDHHRVDNSSSLTNTTNNYIDTQSSSTSEIIATITKLENNNLPIENFNEIATLLTAGVYLDTSNLTKNVSENTFVNLSWLKSSGSDNNYVLNLLKLSSAAVTNILSGVAKVETINNNILIVWTSDDREFTNTEISTIANSLLNFKTIDAGFVMARQNNGIKVSARSNDKVNVQLICEKMDGGGHYSMAAAFFKGQNYTQTKVRDKIILSIKLIYGSAKVTRKQKKTQNKKTGEKNE